MLAYKGSVAKSEKIALFWLTPLVEPVQAAHRQTAVLIGASRSTEMIHFPLTLSQSRILFVYACTFVTH